MKVMFLNPPFEKGVINRPVRFQAVSPQKAVHPPIDLALAAAVLLEDEKVKNEVDVIDAPALDLNFNSTIEKIQEFNPEMLVCLTSTPSVISDAKFVKLVKEKLPELKTVTFGVHASSEPEDTLKRGFDIVARGEIEYTVKDLARKMPLEKVLGINYLKKGRMISNPQRPLIQNLDELPFPARQFLPNYKYYSALYRNPFTFLNAGRGCPFQCIFCATPKVISGRGYRLRSPENVLAELKHLKENYKFKSVLFNDDTLTASPKNTEKLCDLMIKEKIKMPWVCYSRVDTITQDLADKMKKAGCFLVKIGFESGNDALLQRMKKGPNATTVQALKAARIFNKAKIQVHGTFVFGLPGETKETIRETIEFAKKLDIDFVQFSIAQPYPGTELYDYLKEKGHLKVKDWDSYLNECGNVAPVFEYEHLSKEELEQAIKIAYKEYYLRAGFLFKAIRKRITNPNLLKSSFKSGKNLLTYMRS
ncbi:MAG: radical SAM protein [archaeon]